MITYNFFFGIIDSQKGYHSFSVGNVWLFFYQDVHIATVDFTKDQAFKLKADNPPANDGYSHRHLVNLTVVDDIPDIKLPENVQYLSDDDLLKQTFNMISWAITDEIDREMGLEKSAV